ncbi:MAG: hypothetical protein P4L33_03395 [Capsulimonadaceae bacterium]|nr:hypothetical protein [Capsulimonadaceae bacterium]
MQSCGEDDEDRYEEGFSANAAQLIEKYCNHLAVDKKATSKHLKNVRWVLTSILVEYGEKLKALPPQKWGKRDREQKDAQLRKAIEAANPVKGVAV